MPGVPGSSGTCGFGPSVSVTFEYAPPAPQCCGVRCCPDPPICCPCPCPPPPPCPQLPPSRACPTSFCGARCATPAAVPEPTIQPIQILGCTPHVCCACHHRPPPC